MLRRLVLFFSVLPCLFASSVAHANVAVVLNSGNASVTLPDQATFQELDSIPVGKEPHHLMSTPDNKSLIVSSAMGNELILLDPKTGQVQGRIKDVTDPYQIGFSPDQKRMVEFAGRRFI